MQLVVAIATAGRKDVLADVIDHLAGQTRLPDRLVICPATPADLDETRLARFPAPFAVVTGARGSCAQRNAILDACPEADVIIFFDDDFLPAFDFLANAECLFAENPGVAVATGKVLADGISGPGYSIAEGHAILAADAAANAAIAPPFPVYNAYGCNMAFRMAAIARHHTRFDEAMPLYGWQEDVDFCRRLASEGQIVNSPSLRGVHLAARRGRTSGLRFGYSQIANPLYLLAKGSVSWHWAFRLMARNVATNLLGSFGPQDLIDRRGRLKGNVIAVWEGINGKMSPGRIIALQ